MRRMVLAFATVSVCVVAHAEDYVCTYTGFGVPNEPVILRFQVQGQKAYEVTKNKNNFGKESDIKTEWTILTNTPTGIVLAQSFAYHNQYTKQEAVGMLALAINKNTLRMTRGNVIEGDSEGAIRHGRCIKN